MLADDVLKEPVLGFNHVRTSQRRYPAILEKAF